MERERDRERDRERERAREREISIWSPHLWIDFEYAVMLKIKPAMFSTDWCGGYVDYSWKIILGGYPPPTFKALKQWEHIFTHTVTYHIETWDDLAGTSQETSEAHIFSHPTGLFLEVSLWNHFRNREVRIRMLGPMLTSSWYCWGSFILGQRYCLVLACRLTLHVLVGSVDVPNLHDTWLDGKKVKSSSYAVSRSFNG